MRFGKRLAEVTQSGRDTQPYISYKELKKKVGEISRIVGSGNDEDGDNSSGDEAACSASASAASAAPQDTGMLFASGGATGSTSRFQPQRAVGGASRLEAKQHEFFMRIDGDLERASGHVQSIIASLEAAVGEWQSAAIVAGILFTDVQLDEVSSQLPFQVPDRQMLVKWLMDFQPAAWQKAQRQGLVSRYTAIANTMNSLLQYIEVNLTAVRKILKKFEKKVPSEWRMRHARDYTMHHELFMPSMQHLLVTVAHMQRLMASSGASEGAAAVAAPISQIGPESLAVLTRLRGSTSGPAALDEVLGGQPPARIDVYAKPGVDADNGASGGGQRAPQEVLGKASQSANAMSSAASSNPHAPKTLIPGGAAGYAGNSSAASEASYPPALPNSSSSHNGGASQVQQGQGQSSGSQQQDTNARGGRKRGGRGGGGKGARGQRGSGGQHVQANSAGGGRPAQPSPQSSPQEQQSHAGSGSGSSHSAGQVASGFVQNQAGGGAPVTNVAGMPYFFTQVPVYMGQQQQQQQQPGGYKGAGSQPSQSSAATAGAVPQGVFQALDPNQWLAMQMRMMPPWPAQVGMTQMEGGYPMASQRI